MNMCLKGGCPFKGRSPYVSKVSSSVRVPTFSRTRSDLIHGSWHTFPTILPGFSQVLLCKVGKPGRNLERVRDEVKTRSGKDCDKLWYAPALLHWREICYKLRIMCRLSEFIHFTGQGLHHVLQFEVEDGGCHGAGADAAADI
jgi:hypothetical protein